MPERRPWLPFPDPLGVIEKATEDAPIQLRDPLRQILGGASHSSSPGRVRFIGACKVVNGFCQTHGQTVSKQVRCPYSQLTDEEWEAVWEVAEAAFPEGQSNPWVNGWWPATLEEAERAITGYSTRMRDAARRYAQRMHEAAYKYGQSTEKAISQYRRYVMGEYERGRVRAPA